MWNSIMTLKNIAKVIDSHIEWKLSCSLVGLRKMLGRQWTKEANIAIFNDHTLYAAPSPGNPSEYLHKPYTAKNNVLWATFLSLTVYGSSEKFRTVLSESRRRQPISSRVRNRWTHSRHSRSFNVIYLGIIEEPLRGYIAQYNKCGLSCEGSKDITSERSENRHF